MALTASATNPAEVPRHFALPVLAVMTIACHALPDISSAMIVNAMKLVDHQDIIVRLGHVVMTDVCHVIPGT